MTDMNLNHTDGNSTLIIDGVTYEVTFLMLNHKKGLIEVNYLREEDVV